MWEKLEVGDYYYVDVCVCVCLWEENRGCGINEQNRDFI